MDVDMNCDFANMASLTAKMKRKDLEAVTGNFSEFSFPTPARKIRRLCMELPPIMEGEEPLFPLVHDQIAKPMEVPVLNHPLNEERALVMYKPTQELQLHDLQFPSSCKLPFIVNADLVPILKNKLSCITLAAITSKLNEDEASSSVSDGDAVAGSLAVVPWNQSWHQHQAQVPAAYSVGESEMEGMLSEPMELEAMDASAVEVKEHPHGHRMDQGGMVGEGMQQWPQPYCMNPQAQLHQNASTPVMWSW